MSRDWCEIYYAIDVDEAITELISQWDGYSDYIEKSPELNAFYLGLQIGLNALGKMLKEITVKKDSIEEWDGKGERPY